MNLDEFVSDYIACCNDGEWTNRDIAEAWAEATMAPGDEHKDYMAEVERIEPQLSYYTGRD